MLHGAIQAINPSFTAEVFVTNVVPYDLRGRTNLKLEQTSMASILSGSLVIKLWQTMPQEIEESQNLEVFDRNIKSITIECSCKLCKSFIVNLGFL